MNNRIFIGSRLTLSVLVSVISVLTATSIETTAQIRTRRISGGTSRSEKLKVPKQQQKGSFDGEIKGESSYGALGIDRITSEIMQAQQFAAPSLRPPILPERDVERVRGRKQNPDAPAVASWPDPKAARPATESSFADLGPQSLSTNFTGATLTDTGAFPPDSMGAVGPSQFVVFVNGRLRTFNKTTGSADGVLNVNPDTFFSSVMTPVTGTVVLNFTSDPQVRYDRLTGRWMLSIIDVPCTNATCTTTAGNRWLLAVSDPGSSAAITNSTVWTFYQVQTDLTGFCDYPSLGVDANALYFGCNMFSSTGTFVGTNGYVVRKSSVLSGGPMFTTKFANLATNVVAGPYAPRGVDNYSPIATEGYFIGVDILVFSQLDVMRVSNPGSLTPTISANIPITVPTTTSPNPVTHSGNTGGNNGRLDSLDDRIYAAHIRNGRLWTAHNFRVSAAGVANTAAAARNAVRWYELNVPVGSGTPTVVQSGTIFDSAATLAAARQFWIPSIMVSGQGHAAIAFSTAGTPFFADTAFTGRLASDTLGTMQTFTQVTSSSTAYNPASDPGGSAGRRWGDYSYTSLDPLDDMTMWSIQEFCSGTNSYGVRVAKLLPPPPATPASTDHPTVNYGVSSINVVVTGTSVSGSGFFDPGTDLPAPARPFSHISASVTGGVTVNSITYNSPTQVTLNISTVGANVGGPQDITITNPDGQSKTTTGLINVLLPTAAPANIGGRITDDYGNGIAFVNIQIVSPNGTFSASTITNSFGYFQFDNVPTGVTYIITPRSKKYSFDPENLVYSHLDQVTDLGFHVQSR